MMMDDFMPLIDPDRVVMLDFSAPPTITYAMLDMAALRSGADRIKAEWLKQYQAEWLKQYQTVMPTETCLLIDVWPVIAPVLPLSTRQKNIVARMLTWERAVVRRNGGSDPIDPSTLTVAEFIRLLREHRLQMRGLGVAVRRELLKALTGHPD